MQVKKELWQTNTCLPHAGFELYSITLKNTVCLPYMYTYTYSH